MSVEIEDRENQPPAARRPRTLLAVIDETPECERAVTYAAYRAKATNGVLKLLYVIEPAEFQHWLGVEDIMRGEAMAEAQERLSGFVENVRARLSIEAQTEIREGDRAEAIRELITEQPDIKLLVLAASAGNEGPGPLVSSLAGREAAFPIPVTVIPGTMTDADIESMG